ncbi:hypothetical protein AHAS_Ahas10G0074700 [Arachis hypogaea]
MAEFTLAAIQTPPRRGFHNGQKAIAIVVTAWRTAMKMAKIAVQPLQLKNDSSSLSCPKRLSVPVLFLSSMCLLSPGIFATACRRRMPSPVAVCHYPSPLVIAATHHHSSLFSLSTMSTSRPAPNSDAPTPIPASASAGHAVGTAHARPTAAVCASKIDPW